MVEQVSLFTENKKGMMQDITGILTENNINIISLVTNDCGEFGVIRMLVSDPQTAAKAFQARDYLTHVDNVLCVEMKDVPGGLNSLLRDIAGSNIDVDYVYTSFDRETSMPIAVIQVQDMEDVEICLRGYGHVCRD